MICNAGILSSYCQLKLKKSPSSTLFKERNGPKRSFLIVAVVVVVAVAVKLLQELEIPKAKLRPFTAKQDMNSSSFFF